jgi:hypothetical protein
LKRNGKLTSSTELELHTFKSTIGFYFEKFLKSVVLMNAQQVWKDINGKCFIKKDV